MEHEGQQSVIDLTENDLLFITNGGCVESSTYGDQNTRAAYDTSLKPGNGWDLWKKIAAQDPSFGHPEKFCGDPEESNWMSATITTLDDKIPPYIQQHLQARPLHRPHRHRRHRDREGFQLAPVLDAQPSAAVQGSAARTSCAFGFTVCSRTSPATM